MHTIQICFTILIRPHFYQTRSAWSMDQGSNENHSPVNSFAPTVTKFCVMWEGQALPHDTKFGNCRDKIVDSRAFLSWSLIHGSSWSGLIKVGPGMNANAVTHTYECRQIPSISRTKYQHLNDSRLILQLPWPNPLKPGAKSRMKMQLEQRRQAMLQLHLSDHQFHII